MGCNCIIFIVGSILLLLQIAFFINNAISKSKFTSVGVMPINYLPPSEWFPPRKMGGSLQCSNPSHIAENVKQRDDLSKWFYNATQQDQLKNYETVN